MHRTQWMQSGFEEELDMESSIALAPGNEMKSSIFMEFWGSNWPVAFLVKGIDNIDL